MIEAKCPKCNREWANLTGSCKTPTGCGGVIITEEFLCGKCNYCFSIERKLEPLPYMKKEDTLFCDTHNIQIHDLVVSHNALVERVEKLGKDKCLSQEVTISVFNHLVDRVATLEKELEEEWFCACCGLKSHKPHSHCYKDRCRI